MTHIARECLSPCGLFAARIHPGLDHEGLEHESQTVRSHPGGPAARAAGPIFGDEDPSWTGQISPGHSQVVEHSFEGRRGHPEYPVLSALALIDLERRTAVQILVEVLDSEVGSLLDPEPRA